MQIAFPLRRQRNVGRAFVVSLMIMLWLGTSILALSPSLHHWLHKDSQSVTHHCLITQLGKSPGLTGFSGIPPVAPPPVGLGCLCLDDALEIFAADYRLSPSRAPPAFPSSITVVG